MDLICRRVKLITGAFAGSRFNQAQQQLTFSQTGRSGPVEASAARPVVQIESAAFDLGGAGIRLGNLKTVGFERGEEFAAAGGNGDRIRHRGDGSARTLLAPSGDILKRIPARPGLDITGIPIRPADRAKLTSAAASG